MKELCYFKYTNLYFKWFSKLDKGYRLIVIKALEDIEDGKLGKLKHIKKILFELRLDIGQGIRIYLIQDGDTLVVILSAGDKNTQQRDINKAIELMEIYLELKEKGELEQWLKK